MVRLDLCNCHQFPRGGTRLAVGRSCGCLLVFRDPRDRPGERGIAVDAATIYRRAINYGPEVGIGADRTTRAWSGLKRNVDKTYPRVDGRRPGFRSQRAAKATFGRAETMKINQEGRSRNCEPGLRNKIAFVSNIAPEDA